MDLLEVALSTFFVYKKLERRSMLFLSATNGDRVAFAHISNNVFVHKPNFLGFSDVKCVMEPMHKTATSKNIFKSADIKIDISCDLYKLLKLVYVTNHSTPAFILS